MNFITLTTDFGYKDFSVAITKANIYNNINDVIIVDISHQISPFNTPQAAYILKNSYNSFPEGTIHIIGVESELTPENSHLAMRFNNHYFVGANNGIFSFLAIKSFKAISIPAIHCAIGPGSPDCIDKILVLLLKNANVSLGELIS